MKKISSHVLEELSESWERSAEPTEWEEYSDDEGGRLASAKVFAIRKTLKDCAQDLRQVLSLLSREDE